MNNGIKIGTIEVKYNDGLSMLPHITRPLYQIGRHVFLAALALLNALVFASSAAALTLQFVDQDGNPVSAVVVEPQRNTIENAPSGTAIIDQVNRTFVPMIALIHPGQWVEFPNSDNVRHHVYSFSAIRQFSTPLYADEGVDPVQFNQPGIAVLGCNIHDSMVAYVYVSEWHGAVQADEMGRATLQHDYELPVELSIWHPWLQTSDNRQQLTIAETPTSQLTVILNIENPSQTGGFRALRERRQ